jgi:pyridoxamine 5'-phosphate oxidase
MAAPRPLETAQAIKARIWQELERASRDRHHEWRTPVLASIDLVQQPSARTVVLREVNLQEKCFEIYSDRRSPKIAELKQHPGALLHFWSKRLQWQLRVAVKVHVLESGPDVESRWDRLKLTAAARDYLSPHPPGSLMEKPAEPSAEKMAGLLLAKGMEPALHKEVDHNFCLVRAGFVEMDWLELNVAGHRRARFSVDEWQWLLP